MAEKGNTGPGPYGASRLRVGEPEQLLVHAELRVFQVEPVYSSARERGRGQSGSSVSDERWDGGMGMRIAGDPSSPLAGNKKGVCGYSNQYVGSVGIESCPCGGNGEGGEEGRESAVNPVCPWLPRTLHRREDNRSPDSP